MYDKVDCLNCEEYEYDDPTLFNNCIHYHRCLARQEAQKKEEKKRERIRQKERI